MRSLLLLLVAVLIIPGAQAATPGPEDCAHAADGVVGGYFEADAGCEFTAAGRTFGAGVDASVNTCVPCGNDFDIGLEQRAGPVDGGCTTQKRLSDPLLRCGYSQGNCGVWFNDRDEGTVVGCPA